MPFDLEMSALSAVLRPGVQLERVLADAQRQRELPVDVKMAAKLRRVGQTKSQRPAARILKVHPRGNRLTGLTVDHINRQLTIATRSRMARLATRGHCSERENSGKQYPKSIHCGVSKCLALGPLFNNSSLARPRFSEGA